MEDGDDWIAPDKVYHVLFCFFIAMITTVLAERARYPFIRRRSILIGSIVSLAAGAAKEVADELGYFRSAGASTKDAVADVFGTLIAAFALSLYKKSSFIHRTTDQSLQAKALQMV
ncbi:uncharacterized protein LOC132633035 [Lycium barbarum]|uniref:uncharacterized protein LOC132633035 n=1 Tax=Lycium barbarum TaxID=112863 RepID=UPI00293E17DB|nr:uncharacterized protein LOC132633035 [Lycium barbarum]XP_060205212.1 uncharacterized protein LOC132633035 [Lycium barbarum]XP_060205214.1 uncharacterized protein LOC132633035 [Lycium barbarum]